MRILCLILAFVVIQHGLATGSDGDRISDSLSMESNGDSQSNNSALNVIDNRFKQINQGEIYRKNGHIPRHRVAGMRAQDRVVDNSPGSDTSGSIMTRDDRVKTSFDDSNNAGTTVPSRFAQTDGLTGKQRLAAIDQKFRDMIKQEPVGWDLKSLELEYQRLESELGQAVVSSAISLRREAIERYRSIQRDHSEFHELISKTKQRDAELLARQSHYQSQLPSSPGFQANPNSMFQQAEIARLPQSESATSFDGAGIVQQLPPAVPGGPEYALISPSGNLLTYLQPGPGVDLNRYNGRSIGVTGRRERRSDWNADSITVRSAQVVQLRATR